MIQILEEMCYQQHRTRRVLAYGEVDGYKFVVLNLGTHPTAYVCAPQKHPIYRMKWKEIEDKYENVFDSVHGGLTYADNTLDGDESYTPERGWWVGWDYAHCNDFAGYYVPSDGSLYSLKRWTVKEILNDVSEIIKELENVERESR